MASNASPPGKAARNDLDDLEVGPLQLLAIRAMNLVIEAVGRVLDTAVLLPRPRLLWAFERGWLWLSALALASIPLSGQVHLALGAIPFVLAYMLVRRRDRRAIVAVRKRFVSRCGTPDSSGRPVGATGSISGIGFWDAPHGQT